MSHKTPAKKAEQKKPAKDAGGKLTPEQEAVKAQKPASGVRTGFTVLRIKAATVITLAANSVARAETTEEGTVDRNVMVKELDSSFMKVKICIEECAKENDTEVETYLRSGYDVYSDYIAKHERVNSLPAGDPARAAAIAEADKALDALDLKVSDLLRAF